MKSLKNNISAKIQKSIIGLIFFFLLASIAAAPVALADHPDDGLGDQLHSMLDSGWRDASSELSAHDEVTGNIVSSGPSAKVIKNVAPSGRGERLEPDATTDVWALGKYAYTGTFNNPCGGDQDAGVQIWDVHNHNKAEFVGVIPSPTGSRSNDVKAAAMNSGDILVHSNESCGGGPGGFEIYNVDDPNNPVYLASVQTDDVNLLLQTSFGFIDFGVHNLWLFTQGEKDYVAATVESLFGNFQIFDITDPTNPTLVGFWGAEQSPNAVANGVPAGVDWVNTIDFGGVILPGNAYNNSGFGASQNRFLHDITISADGTRAYLSNWDEGLVLLDISDPANPVYVSTAIDVANGSRDGEVNSHSAWPNEDGTVVVEGEEDFSAWEATIPPGNLTLDSAVPGDPTIPATAISTVAGDDFESNQTGNVGTTDGTSVVVNTGPLAGNTYDAIELATAAGSPTFATTGPLTGELVWIGRACPGDTILNAGDVDAGDIAVVRRGACFFEEKANTAASLGASTVVIANNQDSTPWSGLRIWDYSDPANPVLASIFDTTCSASTAPGGPCDPAGTYSSHNVIVEKNKAYVSWYWDGVLVIDISDPYNPVEVGRYFRSDDDFTAQNGGPQDVWGIYKVTNSPWIYSSDRNGGLYVLKEFGSGSAQKGQN
jgi:hypothetical protein